MDKKTYSIRILLLIGCFSIGLLSFYQMNQSYDPLARYPYATDENREFILKYLDAQDIDYLITQQIKPEVFMDFIDEPEFDIHNALFYDIAKKNQDAPDDAYIVNFVNKYRSNFSKEILTQLLSHYSYVDLTTFFENESIFNNELTLVSDPSNPYVILNDEKTVYKYIPESLVTVDKIKVRKEIVEDLKAMQSDFASIMNDEYTLDIQYGYTSYEQILAKYSNITEDEDEIKKIIDPAGQSEYQLGFTIALKEHKEWIELSLNQEATSGKKELSDEAKLKQEWLQENAYRYGFILRYPKDKETKTNKPYQPFVLRYVGKISAKKMVQSDLVMEEMKFEAELH